MAANSAKETLPTTFRSSKRMRRVWFVRLANDRKAETSATCVETVDIYACKTLSSGPQKASFWPKNGLRSNLIYTASNIPSTFLGEGGGADPLSCCVRKPAPLTWPLRIWWLRPSLHVAHSFTRATCTVPLQKIHWLQISYVISLEKLPMQHRTDWSVATVVRIVTASAKDLWPTEAMLVTKTEPCFNPSLSPIQHCDSSNHHIGCINNKVQGLGKEAGFSEASEKYMNELKTLSRIVDHHWRSQKHPCPVCEKSQLEISVMDSLSTWRNTIELTWTWNKTGLAVGVLMREFR